MTIDVQEAVRWLKIESSNPPNGAIDARILTASKGRAHGTWSSVELTITRNANELTADDFTIEDGTNTPPKIRRFSANGSVVTLTFDRPIRPGAWTTVTHKASGTNTKIGCFPGDVNGDGRSDARDVLALIDALNGVQPLPEFRFDIDRDGATKTTDVLRVIDLLTAPPSDRAGPAKRPNP